MMPSLSLCELGFQRSPNLALRMSTFTLFANWLEGSLVLQGSAHGGQYGLTLAFIEASFDLHPGTAFQAFAKGNRLGVAGSGPTFFTTLVRSQA